MGIREDGDDIVYGGGDGVGECTCLCRMAMTKSSIGIESCERAVRAVDVSSLWNESIAACFG